MSRRLRERFDIDHATIQLEIGTRRLAEPAH
jgi:hypothetical protein